jgi:radical SAM superfamily enzyme YgiQ (UPF0313 family)
MKIFFGDLFHTWTKGGIWTIPLNVGYVASYAKHKMLTEKNLEIKVKLFKDAKKLLDEIDRDPPDIVALGFFVWNEKLNSFVFDYVKEKYPKTLTVGGGPRFTNLNANKEGAKIFFNKVNNCDIFVVNQGEKGFYRVIKKFYEVNKSIEQITSEELPGSIVQSKKNKQIEIKNCLNENHIVGENIGSLEDLNEIPSPYLSGLLDDFFQDRWMPILETNRSCPYRCTFCAWGIGTQKLLKFDEKRVIDEIEYIAKRCNKTPTLFIADANFGILERDAIFAKKIYEMYKTYNFPSNVAVQWNKTRPDRIIKVAQEFKEIAAVGASMQSLDNNVLEAIKRKNLTFDQILNMQDSLKKLGINENSFTELIIGLPNETKESHLMANKKLIDFGFEIQNYFLHLLPGTEMDDKDYRQKYFKKTFYRLFDNSYGIYREKKIIECQETIGETNTMKHSDFKFFRFFHFLIQMMWGKKWYYYFLIFLKTKYSIHPVDFIEKMVNLLPQEKGKFREIYDSFINDYLNTECFEDEKELINFWSKKENFNRLEMGDYGKLNMLYTYKVVLGCRLEFNDFLLKVCKKFMTEKKISENLFLNEIKNILKFQNCKNLYLNTDLKYKKDFSENFEFDILDWINNNFKDTNYKVKNTKIRFFIPKSQTELLDAQLFNNKGKNLNSKLRDMTVYSSSKQFFYNVEVLDK